jgi:hypothetical protein
VQTGYKEAFGREVKSLPGNELWSRKIELSWQLQNKGKKGIRR